MMQLTRMLVAVLVGAGWDVGALVLDVDGEIEGDWDGILFEM